MVRGCRRTVISMYFKPKEEDVDQVLDERSSGPSAMCCAVPVIDIMFFQSYSFGCRVSYFMDHQELGKLCSQELLHITQTVRLSGYQGPSWCRSTLVKVLAWFASCL